MNPLSDFVGFNQRVERLVKKQCHDGIFQALCSRGAPQGKNAS